MRYYLAYGSNLNAEQMRFRCPGAEMVGTTKIQDHELVFRRGYLTIEPKEGSYVPAGVWKITPSDEAALDRYEGFPRFYAKKEIPITFTRFRYDGRQYEETNECLVYVMQPGFQIEEPSSMYIRTVNQGYNDFGFDAEEWEMLFLAHMRAKEARK